MKGAQKHTSSERWTLLAWGLRDFPQHPPQISGLSGSPCTQLCPQDPCERGWWHSTLVQSEPALTGKYRLFTTTGHSCFLWFASLCRCTGILMWVHAQLSTHLTVIQRKSQIKRPLRLRHTNLGNCSSSDGGEFKYVSILERLPR